MSEETTSPVDKDISYKKAVDYWSTVPATVDGVLGGFGNSIIPKADVLGSLTFLRKVKSFLPSFATASNENYGKYGCDMGAGVGRVTRGVLSVVCDCIDLVEPVEPFVTQAHKDLADLKAEGKIGTIYQMGMQDFTPEINKYWLIWCQWCLSQLTDQDLIAFLKRCANGLQNNGIIVVKENNSSSEDEFDYLDSSVTRTNENYCHLFKESGFRVLHTELQRGFPAEIYPVKMYALRPI